MTNGLARPHWHRHATALAHGVGVWAASEAAARVLVVKGRSADYWGLREPRVAADVDLLVEPVNFESLVEFLARAGWGSRETSATYRATTTHALTLVHPAWPCDIDVHSRFPGLLGDPSEVFDVLWRDREQIAVAGVAVAIPGRVHTALILGLHALHSSTANPRHAIEFERVARAIREDESLASALLEAAHEMGALQTAAPLLEAGGLEPPPPEGNPSEELLAWWARGAAGSNPTAVSLNYVLGLPWRKRPVAMWRLFWPTAEDIRRDHPELGSGPATILRGRISRFGRGLVALPGAIRARRAAHRGIASNRVADAARREGAT